MRPYSFRGPISLVINLAFLLMLFLYKIQKIFFECYCVLETVLASLWISNGQ